MQVGNSGRHRMLDYAAAVLEAKIYLNDKLPTAQYLYVYTMVHKKRATFIFFR